MNRALRSVISPWSCWASAIDVWERLHWLYVTSLVNSIQLIKIYLQILMKIRGWFHPVYTVIKRILMFVSRDFINHLGTRWKYICRCVYVWNAVGIEIQSMAGKLFIGDKALVSVSSAVELFHVQNRRKKWQWTRTSGDWKRAIRSRYINASSGVGMTKVPYLHIWEGVAWLSPRNIYKHL